MLDIKWIRAHPEAFDQALKHRVKDVKAQTILAEEAKYRETLTHLQDLQTQRNQLAKLYGTAKQRQEDTSAFAHQAEDIKQKMSVLEGESQAQERSLHALLAALPNIPASDVPEGKDETQNVCIRTVGDIPSFSFTPQPHYDLGEALGLMNFEQATKLSGARFVVLYGTLSRLERALAAFMLDIHTTEFGYQETSVPLLVNEAAMFGTGQLPKFREDQFQVSTGHWLIPTGEVPLTNLVAQDILEEGQLPLRFTGYTHCFRAEAGAAGRDTRGMIRQHQFSKVELVSITTPEQSEAEHERMAKAAETILQRLKLPYRVMLLCAGDMGFSARKTYDLEVWLPSQNMYREISSCSNCHDFQARRMNARYRVQGGPSKPQFVHTLNGSGLAIGRTLIAVLENYQQEDGSIKIPDALVPYMGGLSTLIRE